MDSAKLILYCVLAAGAGGLITSEVATRNPQGGVMAPKAYFVENGTRYPTDRELTEHMNDMAKQGWHLNTVALGTIVWER